MAASLLPLVGVLAYAPWPAYEERYAFPYLMGPCLLIAIGVTHLERASRAGILGALSLWATISAVGSTDAAAYSSGAEATHRTVDAVVGVVAQQPQLDSVFVASNITLYPAWTGMGPSLRRLAAVTDRGWPSTRDIRCEDVMRLAIPLAIRHRVRFILGHTSHKNISGYSESALVHGLAKLAAHRRLSPSKRYHPDRSR
jgi:hypothetical protein